MSAECTDPQCREDLIERIDKRPTVKGIIAIISIPVAILGVIVALVALLYGKSVEINAASIQAVSAIIAENKRINERQEDRIRAIELAQAHYIAEVRQMNESLNRIVEVIRDIRRKQDNKQIIK